MQLTPEALTPEALQVLSLSAQSLGMSISNYVLTYGFYPHDDIISDYKRTFRSTKHTKLVSDLIYLGIYLGINPGINSGMTSERLQSVRAYDVSTLIGVFYWLKVHYWERLIRIVDLEQALEEQLLSQIRVPYDKLKVFTSRFSIVLMGAQVSASQACLAQKIVFIAYNNKHKMSPQDERLFNQYSRDIIKSSPKLRSLCFDWLYTQIPKIEHPSLDEVASFVTKVRPLKRAVGT